MAAGDPDATTFLEKVEQRVFVHTSTSNIKVGSIVLLKKDNVPPLRWQLGFVEISARCTVACVFRTRMIFCNASF